MEQPINDSPETADLKKQVADLQRQTATLYIGLAVLSLTLAAFIGLQKRRASKELDTIRPQAAQIREEYKKQVPAIEGLVSQLTAYGKTRPDYAQRILIPLGINPNASASNTPPGAAIPPR